MDYIVHRPFRGTALCGPVDLRAGTEVECREGLLLHRGRALCAAGSENAHRCFARNDDGQGLERGRLTRAILQALARPGPDCQARWDKVWADPLCRKYRRTDHAGYWLWNHAFYNAPLFDLWHIARLVGIKKPPRSGAAGATGRQGGP